jgi:adenine deaminase
MLRLPTAADRSALVATTLGQRPPDLIIRGGTLLNVHTGESYPADVATCGTWIADVGELGVVAGPDTVVIDATGYLLCPGLINPHFHIESSMLTVHELAGLLLPTGETTITHDPHEIGNVLGFAGIEAISEEGVDLPLKVLLRVPAQVPAVPGFETTAGELSSEEVVELLDRPYTISLAGDYNVSWVLNGGIEHLAKIEAAQRRGLTINGQEAGLPAVLRSAYTAGGPEDSEVPITVEDIMGELRQGMRAMLNVMPMGLNDSDMTAIAKFVGDNAISTRHLLLCVTDAHPNLIARRGSMVEAVRMAIRDGFEPLAAVQMATLNVAEHYRVGHLLGSVSPGRVADIVFVSDLETFTVDRVIADGKLVAEAGQLVARFARFSYPAWAKDTVHLARPLEPADFVVAAEAAGPATVRVIGPGCPKPEMRFDLPVAGGAILADPSQDIACIAVVDRHLASGRIGLGFIHGMGLARGAAACTINHDSHNLVVVGTNVVDMACAANAAADGGGGCAVALDGEVLGRLPLPVAGLMSEAPAAEVVAGLNELENLLVEHLGVPADVTTPFMWFQVATLPNLPEIGLTDLGLFDTLNYRPIELLIS